MTINNNTQSETFLYVRIPDIIYHSKPTNIVVYKGFDSYYSDENTKVPNYICRLKDTASKTKTKIHFKNDFFEKIKFLGVRNCLMGKTFCIEIPNVGVIEVENTFISYVLTNGLMNSDNTLKGKYKFIKFNSDIHLVNADSPMFKRAINVEQRFKEKRLNIEKFDFEPGVVYKTPSGQLGLFLGYMSTINFEIETETKEKGLQKKALKTLIYSMVDDDDYSDIKYSIRTKQKNFVGLWMEVGNINSFGMKLILNKKEMDEVIFGSLESNIQFLSDMPFVKPSGFELKKRTTYIERCPEIPKINIPDNVVQQIKNSSKKGFNKLIKTQENAKDPNSFYHGVLACEYAPFINMNYLGFTKTCDSYFDYLIDRIK